MTAELSRALSDYACVQRAIGALMHLHGLTADEARQALSQVGAGASTTLAQAARVTLGALTRPTPEPGPRLPEP
ncbi:ANTAR domain-containing protein [Cellulomonas cellasea]|uniref:AmiR/NasT family two-component response regulator n=1 Tax=Cellulomonas cellasea TaxID=43670 RepID=A0A7W4YEE9_9CELL|nr:ANTAR domain-containing protein [Cellulomonas cellasea]MBB2925511.1 AmiR/NasT family two-component response regulator [Cellulomonas cellasea]